MFKRCIIYLNSDALYKYELVFINIYTYIEVCAQNVFTDKMSEQESLEATSLDSTPALCLVIMLFTTVYADVCFSSQLHFYYLFILKSFFYLVDRERA